MTIPKVYETKIENNKIVLTKSDMPHTIEEGNKKFGPNARFCKGCIIDYAATGYKDSVEEKLIEISKYLEDYKNDGKIPTVKLFETYNVMMYEFRHYVELKFKSFIYQNLGKNPETIHGLNDLYNKFEDKIIKGRFKDDIKDIVTYITNVEGTPDYFRYLSDKNFEEITNIYEIDLDIDVKIKQFLETMNKFEHFIDDYNSSLNKIEGLNAPVDNDTKYVILRYLQKAEPTLRLISLYKLYICDETTIDKELRIICIDEQTLKNKTFYKTFNSNYKILKDLFNKQCEQSSLENKIFIEIYENYNQKEINVEKFIEKFNISENALNISLNNLQKPRLASSAPITKIKTNIYKITNENYYHILIDNKKMFKK